MFKKTLSLLLVTSFLIVSHAQAFEVYEARGPAVLSSPEYDGANDYYIVDLPDHDGEGSVQAVTIRSYTEGYGRIITEKSYTASQEGFSHYHALILNCNSYYEAYMYDEQMKEVGYVKFQSTELVNPVCDSDSAGEEMGSSDGVSDSCDACALLDCPGWEQHMNKLDEIKDAIPPPPNWDKVAKTFGDEIVPRMVNDMEDMLGAPPPPPSPPPALPEPEVDEPELPETPNPAEKLKKTEPEMNDNKELTDSSFAKDEIESGEEIEFREDPNEGYKGKIDNPLETLPEPCQDGPPIPGQSKKDCEYHKTPDRQNPNAPIPSNQGDPTPDNPPVPSGPSEDIPVPEEGAPKPPSPGNSSPDMGDYKKHPDKG